MNETPTEKARRKTIGYYPYKRSAERAAERHRKAYPSRSYEVIPKHGMHAVDELERQTEEKRKEERKYRIEYWETQASAARLTIKTLNEIRRKLDEASHLFVSAESYAFEGKEVITDIHRDVNVIERNLLRLSHDWEALLNKLESLIASEKQR